MVNVERLKLLASVIEGLPPEQFSMTDWDCGAFACIGGWTERLFKGEEADEALGLTEQEKEHLFYPRSSEESMVAGNGIQALSDHPELNQYIWSREIPPTSCARVVRNFADTGVIDWTILLPEAEALTARED